MSALGRKRTELQIKLYRVCHANVLRYIDCAGSDIGLGRGKFLR
jgi:hypothetical protein